MVQTMGKMENRTRETVHDPAAKSSGSLAARETVRLPAIASSDGGMGAYYRVSRWVVLLFFRGWLRMAVKGADNLPKQGPCLLLANHCSYLDPSAVGGAVPREIHYLARRGLFSVPVIGRLIRSFNTHPIRRGGVDREAIRTSVAILNAGYPLLLFPEGTRSRDGKTARPRGGFGMILEGLPETPCIAVRIQGTGRALGRGMVFPRPVKVSVEIGRVFTFEGRGHEQSRREYYAGCALRLEAEWKNLGVDWSEDQPGDRAEEEKKH